MAWLVLAGIGLAGLSGLWFAGKMAQPIQALRAGAVQLGSGDLSQRIEVKTGDELEALAGEFNAMAGRLQESYADLEQKVETRTKELTEILEYQTAISEVLNVISRSPNGHSASLRHDRRNRGLEALRWSGLSRLPLRRGTRIHFTASHGLTPDQVAIQRSNYPLEPSRTTAAARAILNGAIEEIPDVDRDPDYIRQLRGKIVRLSQYHRCANAPGRPRHWCSRHAGGPSRDICPNARSNCSRPSPIRP